MGDGGWAWDLAEHSFDFEANFSGHTTLARFSIVATIIVINSFMCCVLIQLPSSHRMPPFAAGEHNTNCTN